MADHDATMPLAVDAAKSIADLDVLVCALIKGGSPARPWQRQLLARLAQIDRKILVLRMTIALDHSAAEIRGEADQLLALLAVTDAECAKSRNDLTTRAAVRLAFGLEKLVSEVLNG